jgi:hypothetical protein
MPTITTPNPPLNIFDRASVNLTTSWQTVYETPDYLIPADGPNPARTVEAVALLTSMIVTNTDTETIEVSVRIDQGGTTFLVLDKLPVPQNDFALIEFGKQNLPSGDAVQMLVETGQTATAHLSFVLNQRESYTVIP